MSDYMLPAKKKPSAKEGCYLI